LKLLASAIEATSALAASAPMPGIFSSLQLSSATLELYHGPVQVLTLPRLSGRNRRRIDYRHLIWSLVRKPGAFANYCYREELFPTTNFRRAYDALLEAVPTKADRDYLRLLHLAASTSEAEVELAIARLLEAGRTPSYDVVREHAGSSEPTTAPAIAKATHAPAALWQPDIQHVQSDLRCRQPSLHGGLY
jgi:hypothetical protein